MVLKRRNGARRPMLISLSKSRLFAQAAQERTSAHTHAEALSAGEASLFAVELRAYSLRRCVFKIFRFHNRISSYHTLGLFASRGGTFSLNFTVLLVFWPKVWYCKRNVLLKGGYTQMGWNGCIFFKKGQI